MHMECVIESDKYSHRENVNAHLQLKPETLMHVFVR